MNKKSQIEIQFNWIFILIVGALILLFFSVIVLKQKQSSDDAAKIYVSRQVEAIISGIGSTKDTVSEVNLPKIKIEFKCNGFSVGGRATRDTGKMQVFAPSSIETDRIWTWTKDWSMPYRITNFIYILSPNDIQYVFVSSDNCVSGLCNQVKELVPEEAGVIFVSDPSNIPYKGQEKTRIIFFDGMPSSIPQKLRKASDKDITALTIAGDKGKGTLRFYQKYGSFFQQVGESKYLKLSSLLGAVITDDLSNYECVMETAFERLKIVSSVYESRTSQLKNFYTEGACPNLLNQAYITVSSITSLAGTFESADISSIYSFAEDLEAQNIQIMRNSCAAVY